MKPDIDLRTEFLKILHGEMGVNSPIYKKLILRTLTERCLCNDPIAGGRKLQDCKYCAGEGYLWKEYAVKGYMTFIESSTAEAFNTAYPVFESASNLGYVYTDWNTIPPAPNDSFFVLRLNSDGSLYYFVDKFGKKQLVRLEKWIVVSSDRLNSDDTQPDFLRVLVKKDLTFMKRPTTHTRF